MGFPRSASGVLGPVQDGLAPGTHIRPPAPAVDRDRYLALHPAREHPGRRSLFCEEWQTYRSLGDQDITYPIESEAATIDEIIAELKGSSIAERSGRAMDHEAEDAFERLRTAGYM